MGRETNSFALQQLSPAIEIVIQIPLAQLKCHEQVHLQKSYRILY